MTQEQILRARFDSNDAQDLRVLIEHLRLHHVEEVLEVVECFYPRNQIPPKTQFFLEELFEELGHSGSRT
jgi:hypothetical protein